MRGGERASALPDRLSERLYFPSVCKGSDRAQESNVWQAHMIREEHTFLLCTAKPPPYWRPTPSVWGGGCIHPAPAGAALRNH